MRYLGATARHAIYGGQWRRLDRDELHALADKGYFSGAEIFACDRVGIMVTMPRPETSGNRGNGM